MLSVSSGNDSRDKLLMDREKFPISVEADNPFMVSQEFELLTGKQKELVIHLRKNRIELKYDKIRNLLNEKQIESSKIRLNRIPNNPALLNNLGISYLNSGDYENAIRCFEESLAIDSGSFQTLANIAKAYLSAGNPQKALTIYLNVEENAPFNVKVLNNIASILIRLNEYERAKSYIERALKQDAKSLAALSNMAMIFVLENHTDKAINFYRRALSVKTDLPGVLNNIGVCFTIQKNFKKAIKHFLAAHSLKKKDVGILVNLARCYYEKGDADESIRILENYLKSNEESLHIRETLALLNFLRKDYKNSLNHLTVSLKLFESEPGGDDVKERILNNIAVVYQALGEFETAEKFYSLCLNISPLPSPLPICNAANLYFLLDKDETAKKLIDRGLIAFPENTRVKELLGRYYFEVQDYKKAYEILNNVISVDPKVEDAYALLSVIEMEENKDFEKANAILKKGISQHPDSPVLLNNLAYDYLIQDDIESARKILDSIQGRDETFITATRGLLLIKEGNLQEGQRLYNLAKSLAIRNFSPFADLIEQKKNLEVAKYYLRKDNFKEAARLLRKALSIKAKHDYYRSEAEQLINALQVKQRNRLPHPYCF